MIHGIRKLGDIKLRCHCEPGGCWEWAGAMTGSGSPSASIGGKRSVNVRRWVLERSMGEPLGARRAVAVCGNARCVNPAHLQAMTAHEFNMWLSSRGRLSTVAVRLSRAKNARKRSPLTVEDVRRIRAMRAEGLSLRKISQHVPASIETISRITRGVSWVESHSDPFGQLMRLAA